MAGERHCPRCGAALDHRGGCRRCLLALGLALGGPSVESGPVPAAPDDLFSGAPQRVGPFRVLDVLSVKDAGWVSLAEEDGPAGRRVALRVLDSGAGARDVLARLEIEQETLAGVDHPAIAKVVQAAVTSEGQVYIATEWVAGVPFTEYCNRKRLTIHQRLELLAEVCEAVGLAHGRGAFHLNLEPGKVLVEEAGGRARPRVVDFGVARALARPLTEEALYSAGTLLGGALQYASPEHLGPGPLDGRADVYGLGVLLFESLVGVPPFESSRLRRAGWAELVRVIQHEVPSRPSARAGRLGTAAPADVAGQRRTESRRLARELRGDLDWITLKALEKDPHHRYPSARELAADLRRALAGEPVAPGLRASLLRLCRTLR